MQSVYDMERLFHSCRLESEVTKETISFIRNLWAVTRSEDVQIKILNILDRLLNRSVFRIGDVNTTTIYKWLRRLEDSVNPYKKYVIKKF